MHSDETNPFLALFIISLCLVGALGTWFSGTVIMPELAGRVQLGETQQVWLTNAVQSGFVAGALLIARGGRHALSAERGARPPARTGFAPSRLRSGPAPRPCPRAHPAPAG